MDSWIVEATKHTPKVDFDAITHTLCFKGECYPENVMEFVEPIFLWLEKYLEQLDRQVFTLNLELTYFNSSSSKVLLDLFERLDEEATSGKSKNIIVNWIYDVDNDSVEEYGEEFQEDLESLTFNLVLKN